MEWPVNIQGDTQKWPHLIYLPVQWVVVTTAFHFKKKVSIFSYWIQACCPVSDEDLILTNVKLVGTKGSISNPGNVTTTLQSPMPM